MPYNATYRNPLLQFGTLSIDLDLEDNAGIMSPIRIGKNFRSAEQVTEEALTTEAEKEILRLTEEFEVANEQV